MCARAPDTPDDLVGGENVAGEEPAVTPPTEVTDEATAVEEDVELERSIGLVGGLAIGIGTMIGAGIFVFPGLAAAAAGPAAAISFVIGGVVALLVALPASELATAMPRSGGGYYFISRAMGALAGTVVGITLWFGLVFATAFYLVGFGYYALDMLRTLGIPAGAALVAPLAVAAGAAFTILNVTGTENAAALQNGIVAVLLGLLVVFLGIGSVEVVLGDVEPRERFVPYGTMPVFTTAALVFTSYLGFAQVATVAGEIRRPGRNLPRAMVGSVVVVTVMYVLAILVATSVLGPADLARLDEAGMLETAMVEVGRQLLGSIGAFAIVLGGLLATVSSANASVLSSSRAIYATSRDALLPRWASRVNLAYGTPHVALAMAGGPVVVLAATGRVEILAEVASFLHLVMYALICVSLVLLRRDPPDWYEPAFVVPGGPVVPVLGAVTSAGLILFMQPLSQILGLGFIAVTIGWYYYYARGVSLKGVP